MAPIKLVMLRHGESEWNQMDLFCGWYDSVLSDGGKQEAKKAGKVLKKMDYKFDVSFTSLLIRAQETLQIVLAELGQSNVPVVKTWRLNERHYGNLTGLNKAETAEKFGKEQVAVWRRSYDVPAPPMEENHLYYDTIVKDPRYAEDPKSDEIPRFESLKMTIERTLPFWNGTIVPELKQGKRVLIVAHGTSLRALIKQLDSLNEEQIMKLNVPLGIPFVYTLDITTLKPADGGSMQFLEDEATVKKAMEKVAGIGKKSK